LPCQVTLDADAASWHFPPPFALPLTPPFDTFRWPSPPPLMPRALCAMLRESALPSEEAPCAAPFCRRREAPRAQLSRFRH